MPDADISMTAPAFPVRTAEISRSTGETRVALALSLDGGGRAEIATGFGMLDHMLALIAFWAGFDLSLRCEGDLHVDAHHVTEDVGLCLGQALFQALGERRGITRAAWARVPMDEALAEVAVDLSGRPYFSCDTEFTVERVGELETETVREFLYALSYSAGMNLHFKKLSGDNNHHVIEGMFKALGRALADAVSEDPRVKGVLSTKGSL